MQPEITYSLPDLPPQVWFEIATYLSVGEVVILMQLSKKLNEAMRQDLIWQYLLERDLTKLMQFASDQQINFTEKMREYVAWYRYFKKTLLPIQDQEIKVIFQEQVRKLWENSDKIDQLISIYPNYKVSIKVLLNEFFKREDYLNEKNNEMGLKTNHSDNEKFNTIQFQNISRIPLYLKNLSSDQQAAIKVMESSYCKITTITPTLFLFKGLTTLDLASNYLQDIPESIKALSELTKLDLADNCLSTFPKAVIQLTKLKVLTLSNLDALENHKLNTIECVPDEIEQMGSLEQLEMYNVKLREVSTNLMNLNALNLLDLSYNDIHTLPKLFSDTLHKRRVSLNLIGNPVSDKLDFV